MFRSKSKRGFFGRWTTKRAAASSSSAVSMAAAAAAARRGDRGDRGRGPRSGRRGRRGRGRGSISSSSYSSGRRLSSFTRGGGGGSSGASSSDLSSSDLSASSDDEGGELGGAAFGGGGWDEMWRMATPRGSGGEEGAPMLSASDRMELNTLLGQANDLLVSVAGNLPTMIPPAGSNTTTTRATSKRAPDLAAFRDNLASSLSLSEKELFEELLRWEMAASRGNADGADPVSELQGHLDQLDADLAEACRHLDERLKPLLEFHERTRNVCSEAAKLLLETRVNAAKRGGGDGGLIAVRRHR